MTSSIPRVLRSIQGDSLIAIMMSLGIFMIVILGISGYITTLSRQIVVKHDSGDLQETIEERAAFIQRKVILAGGLHNLLRTLMNQEEKFDSVISINLNQADQFQQAFGIPKKESFMLGKNSVTVNYTVYMKKDMDSDIVINVDTLRNLIYIIIDINVTGTTKNQTNQAMFQINANKRLIIHALTE